MNIDTLLQDLGRQTRSSLNASGYTPGAGPFVLPQAQMPQENSPDLTNRLLQIMSGNLSGTLTGGEKLSALGALLKSVSRGSQTSPQDVVRGIQQQKMAEVQGALQIQELRKAAAKQAQTEAFRQQLVDAEADPRRKAFLQIASADAIDKIAADQFSSKDNLDGIRAQLADLYGYGTPEYNQGLKSYIERQQTFAGPGGSVWTQQPVSLPALPSSRASTAAPKQTTTGQAYDPRRAQALAILKARGEI